MKKMNEDKAGLQTRNQNMPGITKKIQKTAANDGKASVTSKKSKASVVKSDTKRKLQFGTEEKENTETLYDSVVIEEECQGF